MFSIEMIISDNIYQVTSIDGDTVSYSRISTSTKDLCWSLSWHGDGGLKTLYEIFVQHFCVIVFTFYITIFHLMSYGSFETFPG